MQINDILKVSSMFFVFSVLRKAMKVTDDEANYLPVMWMEKISIFEVIIFAVLAVVCHIPSLSGYISENESIIKTALVIFIFLTVVQTTISDNMYMKFKKGVVVYSNPLGIRKEVKVSENMVIKEGNDKHVQIWDKGKHLFTIPSVFDKRIAKYFLSDRHFLLDR